MKRKPETYSMLDVLMASPTEPMPQARRDYQLTLMYQGLAAIEAGQDPKPEDWRMLADCANLTESLVATGKVEDPQGALADASEALKGAALRAQAGKGIRLDGPGIQAVRNLLENWSECLSGLPERDVVQAYRHCERRLREIQSGHKKRHDVQIISI